MLIQYVRKENREPFGVVVALGVDQIGWSECNPKDRFNKELGKRIAIGRAERGTNTVPHNQETIDTIAYIAEKTLKYYKAV